MATYSDCGYRLMPENVIRTKSMNNNDYISLNGLAGSTGLSNLMLHMHNNQGYIEMVASTEKSF